MANSDGEVRLDLGPQVCEQLPEYSSLGEQYVQEDHSCFTRYFAARSKSKKVLL